MYGDLDFFLSCWQREAGISSETEADSPAEFLGFLKDGRRNGTYVPPLTIKRDISKLVRLAEPIEEAARDAGITSAFEDGGYRTLLICQLFGLRALRDKRGDDAVDQDGRTYELKTVNLFNSRGERRSSLPGITTEHTLRQTNLERYRQTDVWLIGVFQGFAPVEVWQLSSAQLEPLFVEWEAKIQAAPNYEINNPKIPFHFVMRVGHCHPVTVSVL